MVKKAFRFVLFVMIALALSIPLYAKDNTDLTKSNYKDSDWEMVWNDEFNDTKIDTTKWNFIDKGDGFGNNELQYYTPRPENAYIEKGSLIIKALKEDYKGCEYTSAKLTSQNKGDWTFGKFEIRAKMPKGQGMWPGNLDDAC